MKNDERAVEIIGGVRCESIHGQIVGASCVNCASWAREIGLPFWRASFNAIATAPEAGQCEAQGGVPLIDGWLPRWARADRSPEQP